MSQSRLVSTAFAALLILACAAPAIADSPMTAEQAVAARQAAMKQDGRALRHADQLKGEEAVKALTLAEANYRKLPGLFPKDSITGKSIALPLIWTEFDQFSALFKKGEAAAAQGITAAKAGDTAGYLAAIKVLGSTCDDCHRTFRAKKDG